jgi:hypothetical protein
MRIQLPDELYRRAKQFAAEREMSLAEVAKRGLELLLDHYPSEVTQRWQLPEVNGGGLKIPLDRLHEIAGIGEERD